MRRLVVLPLLLGLTACGGHSGDLADTCTKVSRAWPGNLYDDETTQAFSRRLDAILGDADGEVRRRFAKVQQHTRKAVQARGDNRAVITEGVEVLAALEKVDAACQEVDAPQIGR